MTDKLEYLKLQTEYNYLNQKHQGLKHEIITLLDEVRHLTGVPHQNFMASFHRLEILLNR